MRRLVVLAGLLALLAPIPVRAASGDPPGMLAFDDLLRDGSYRSIIHLVPAAGGQVTDFPGSDGMKVFPSWHGPERLTFAYDWGTTTNGGSTAMDIADANADGSDVRRLTDDHGPGGAAFDHRWPVWSPDGSTLAFVRTESGGDTSVWLIDADGGNERKLADSAAYTGVISWLPDGASLVYARDDGLARVTLAGDVTPLGLAGQTPAVSPDGASVAYTATTNPPTVRLADIDGGHDRELLQGSLPAWSPDGQWLAYLNGGDVLVRRVADGHTITAASIPNHYTTFAIAWQPQAAPGTPSTTVPGQSPAGSTPPPGSAPPKGPVATTGTTAGSTATTGSAAASEAAAASTTASPSTAVRLSKRRSASGGGNGLLVALVVFGLSALGGIAAAVPLRRRARLRSASPTTSTAPRA